MSVKALFLKYYGEINWDSFPQLGNVILAIERKQVIDES